MCACSHLCPPQTKCPLIFQQRLWIRSIFSVLVSDISSNSSFVTCCRWFTCRDTSSCIVRYFAFIRPSENRGRRRCTDSPSRLSCEEIPSFNSGVPLKSRNIGWNTLITLLQCAKFLCDLFFDSREVTFHAVHSGRYENLTFVSIQESCYKLWLNGSKKGWKQGLEHSSL